MPEFPESRALAAFEGHFGGTPTTVGRAPARVELLGNHTDYNNGLVLAAAINRETVAVGRRIEGVGVRAAADAFPDLATFTTRDSGPSTDGSWGRYVRAVVLAMGERYGAPASGFEVAVAGDVPLGAGLSSSASLEAAVAMFLLGEGLVDAGLWAAERREGSALMELARTLRRAENDYVGVSSGLLDQFAALFGQAGHALMLDCATLEHLSLPLGDPAPAIVVCDSRTSRQLADGMYNIRRSECERVVTYFKEHPPASNRDESGVAPPSVETLRDLTLADLHAYWERLDPIGRRRAQHVLSENDRVRRGVEALRQGDPASLGALMSASHVSSRDDFENSSPALDALVEAAEGAPGFLGGKLSGAGWAGCTVNLVRLEDAEAFAADVAEAFEKRTGNAPMAHICQAADGASSRSALSPE